MDGRDIDLKIIVLEKELEKTYLNLQYIQKELECLKEDHKDDTIQINTKLEYIEREMPNKKTYNMLIAIVTAVVGFGFSLAMMFFR